MAADFHQKLLAGLKADLARGAGLQAAAALLGELRPMHAAGVAKVAARDAELAGLLASGAGAAEIFARVEQLAGAKECLACGTCCVTSSPTLYAEDLKLIRNGSLLPHSLFTLRAGERGFSARLGKSDPLETELVKLAEAPGGGCAFLKDCLCSVYDSRPLQCRTLKCWDESHAGLLEGLSRPGREEVLAGDETSCALAREYDLKLPAAELDRALLAACRNEATGELKALEFLELDHRLRAAARARYGFGPRRLALIWGRPARDIMKGYGLSLALGRDGKPRLERGNKLPHRQ